MRTGDLRRTFEFLTAIACQLCETQRIGGDDGFDLIPVSEADDISDITRYRFVVAPVNRIVEDRTLKGNSVVRERGTHMVRIEVPAGGTGGVSGQQARDIAFNDAEQVVRLFEHGRYFRVPGWSDSDQSVLLAAENYADLAIPAYYSPEEYLAFEDGEDEDYDAGIVQEISDYVEVEGQTERTLQVEWATHARKVMELPKPISGGYQAVDHAGEHEPDSPPNWRTLRGADLEDLTAARSYLGQTGDILVIDPPQILEGYDDRDDRQDSDSTYYMPVMINYIATHYPKPNGDVRG